MKQTLEITKDAAVIMLCVIMSVVLTRIESNLNRAIFQMNRPAQQSPEIGDTLDCLKAVLPEGPQQHLVIIVSTGCGFCQDSMPFYKKLIDTSQSSPSIDAHFVVDEASVDMDAILSMLDDTGIAPNTSILPANFKECEFFYTPMLLVVDNQANILAQEVGKLNADGEARILNFLKP